MATWGVHIRIAERFANKYNQLDEAKFAAGNIGADCGQPNKDKSNFTPSIKISHWYDENNKINAVNFYNAHLDKGIEDREKWSFLVGYYIHLMTDIRWRQLIVDFKKTNSHYAKLNTDKKFIWTIKKDWYDLDHVYFSEHPECIFFTAFQHIRDFPDYLDYYPEGAIQKRITSITNFYNSTHDNLDREYVYLSMDDMNVFIEKTIVLIEEDLINKGILRSENDSKEI